MSILEQLHIDSSREATLTSQLKTQLVWLMVTGDLRAGDRLPSIRTLAQRLGIHYLTVRSAYQQFEAEGLVETRQGSGTKVLAYDPQRIVRMVGAVRSHTVGVILPSLSSPFYHAVLEGIEEVACQARTMLFVCSTHDDPLEKMHYYARLAAKNVDGILIASQPPDWLVQNGARPTGGDLPLVSLDCPGDPGDAVLIDLESAGWQATRHLMDHGHRSIGLVTFATPVENVAPIEQGYRRALEEAGIALRVDWVARTGGFGIEAGEQGGTQLLGLVDRPTAIFAITDLIATGVLRIANHFGMRIPQDLALVGFNDIPLASQLLPPLTTVQAPAIELGRRAMQLLQRRIDGEVGEPCQTILPVSLIVRQSCGCNP